MLVRDAQSTLDIPPTYQKNNELYSRLPLADDVVPNDEAKTTDKLIFEIEQTDNTRDGKCAQAKMLANLALPTMIVNFSGQLIWVISSSVIGRLIGSDALGGFVLAALIGNIFGKSFVAGFLYGYSTLAGNAMGSQQFNEVGFLTQRMIIVSLLVFVIISIFWLNVEHVLLFAGEPREIVGFSSTFLQRYCYIFPIDMFIEIIKAFYRCQNICIPFAVMVSMVVPAHYLIVINFVDWYGFDGVAYSHLTSSSIFLGIILLYVTIFKQHNPATWTGWDWQKALDRQKFKEFLALGVPGIFSMAEWWFWDVQAVIAGHFGVIELAAHAMAYNVIPIYFHIPAAVGISVQTRVATMMAEGNSKWAKKVALSAIGINIMLGMFNACTCYFARDYIFSFFLESDHDNGVNNKTINAPTTQSVIAVSETIWLLVSLFTFLDAQLTLMMGIYRGLGLHARLSGFLIFGFFVLGIPIEVFLAFQMGLGLVGLWRGLIFIYLGMVSFLMIRVILMDWSKIDLPLSLVKQDSKPQE